MSTLMFPTFYDEEVILENRRRSSLITRFDLLPIEIQSVNEAEKIGSIGKDIKFDIIDLNGSMYIPAKLKQYSTLNDLQKKLNKTYVSYSKYLEEEDTQKSYVLNSIITNLMSNIDNIIGLPIYDIVKGLYQKDMIRLSDNTLSDKISSSFISDEKKIKEIISSGKAGKQNALQKRFNDLIVYKNELYISTKGLFLNKAIHSDENYELLNSMTKTYKILTSPIDNIEVFVSDIGNIPPAICDFFPIIGNQEIKLKDGLTISTEKNWMEYYDLSTVKKNVFALSISRILKHLKNKMDFNLSDSLIMSFSELIKTRQNIIHDEQEIPFSLIILKNTIKILEDEKGIDKSQILSILKNTEENLTDFLTKYNVLESENEYSLKLS